MPTYTQRDRPLAITTPLGKDVLLATGFRGHEGISQLFKFQVDLLAEVEQKIPFDRIVGLNATLEMRLADDTKRYFSGVVNRFSQGGRDEGFVRFRAELVPALWRLTKKHRSRAFQHLPVPDILRQVFAGMDVAYELLGTYYQRDFCVQYRETDFQFASRVMEEEGIYYFFKHTESGHQMVVTDVPDQHPLVPGQSVVVYEELAGGEREDLRITSWEKTQELRSGKYTLWDHCFEIPGQNLEAKETILDSVVAGTVTHKLGIGGNDQLEIYDYPGRYAQRFDGVGPSGEERPQDLNDLYRDKDRVARIRIEEEEGASLEIAGAGNCGHFVAGHTFTLERHFDADDRYVLTRVEHDARFEGNYRSDKAAPFTYESRFTCRPVALPFRPPRVTSKPVIPGVQTATVVGHRGEPILCDKYGRVKVQFHWDRDGKLDADSSCWLRVAQPWAGKNWGAFFWPRVGNEVVVAFEDGDPDQPLIVGSVYNYENRPPFALPRANMYSGIKSCSLRGSANDHFNGIVFVDEKDHEHLAIHSERSMSFDTEFDKRFGAGRHRSERVGSTCLLSVGQLPGGGGSGGGSAGAGWEKPKPKGIPGFNSLVVYGANFQAALGINHEIALGSNFQICVNPAGLAAGAPGFAPPPAIMAFLGGGLGGDVQFTIGTSATVVMGRAFDINLGPPKMEMSSGGSHIESILLCTILGGLALLWVILYAAFDDDNQRVIEALAFQTLFDLLLGALITAEVIRKEQEMKANIRDGKVFNNEEYLTIKLAETRYAELFGTGDAGLSTFGQAMGLTAAIVGVGVAPLVAVALEERSGFDPDDPAVEPHTHDKATGKVVPEEGAGGH